MSSSVRRVVHEAPHLRRVLRLASALALILGCLLESPAHAEHIVVGPEGAPRALADAVAGASDGDVVELLPGTYREDMLVIVDKRITLRGLGRRTVIDGAGKVGAAPALWLVRGGEVTVENIEFRGARSSNAGGAGLRQEGGRLTVRRCVFQDNEYGLLSANDPAAELTIEASEFGLAPRVVGGLYHLLNVGRIARLDVTGSRFQQGFEGQLIKSRARVSRIAYNFIHDGGRGGASYEVDLPNGGVATLLGNVVGQSPQSQNPVVVAFGGEGSAWERNALYVAHNTLINGRLFPAWFLRVWRDRLPAATPVVAVNNLLVGGGLFGLGARGQFEGNYPATRGMLRDADTYAFELAPSSPWRGRGVDPRGVGGQDLAPKAEFEWPVGTRALEPGRTSWSPGAYQR